MRARRRNPKAVHTVADLATAGAIVASDVAEAIGYRRRLDGV
jgi:predicted ATPase with chaperone activity